MSDFSKSDLREVERLLDKISDKLGGGGPNYGTLDKLKEQLEKVLSRLDEISKKLDKR